MTTDRIQPARVAAPTDRPAQHGDGSGFAALLEFHAAPEAVARPAKRDDEAPATEARAHTGAGTGEDAAAPAQPELSSLLDESRPSLIGLPVIPTSPAQPAHDAVATGCVAIVVPAAAVEPPATTATPAVAAPAATPAIAPAVAPAPPVAAQPAAPAAVPFEATILAPPQAPAAAPTAPVLDGDAPALASPVVPTPAPAGAPGAVPAPVEGEARVVAPVAAAPSPEPATTAAPQSARPAEPAPTVSAESQPAAPAAVAPQPAAPASGAAAPERTVPLYRAPAAVATLLHVAPERGITHARMALRPAELGGIEIRLQATAAGISAQVVADSPEAARLLAQAGDDLRRALEAREVTLLSLEVSTSSEERNRESARGELSDRDGDGSRTGARHAEGEADTAVAPTTATVIELPGGLLVDVLA
jgi:Flagellar hook-length control protein FliK